MDTHPLISRPSSDCETLPFLDQIRSTAQPPIDLAKANLHQLSEREPIKFFPQRAIKEILSPKNGENPVEKILKCHCKTCSRVKAPSKTELKGIAEKITQDGPKASMIMLAIFIYIGHGYLIRYFGPNDRASDISLDSVTEHLRKEENLEKSRNLLSTADVGAFCDIYNSARDIFQPPRFELGGPTRPFEHSYRMPFVEDEPHAEGGSGKVRKFNIHEDYLDQRIKDAHWYRNNSGKFKFARKVLNEDASREIDSNIERDNLAVFTRERHANIIQALCFYEWRGQMNFVFPFVEGTLEKLMSGKWNGPDKDYAKTRHPPHHWLWIQMVGVAEGLGKIHYPQSSVFKKDGKRTIGFHFDLKPANILITSDGELKISDFGLSFIQRINPNSTSYGYFRSGTPRYQAPEVSPSNLQGVASFNTKSATLDIASYEDMPNDIKNKYDVWSFACIALEVLIYLSDDNGIDLLKQFETRVDTEQVGPAFFTSGKLKNCVENAMGSISGPTFIGPAESRHSTWASDTISFLRTMFAFKPESRPSSTEVAETLRKLNTEHTHSPSDELETELRGYSRREYPKERFDDVYWRTANGDISFIKMEGISFTWPDMAGNKWHPCKLNIYCNKIDGHFVIVRSFKEDNMVQSRAQSLAGADFLPLYVYSSQDRPETYECGIRDKDMEVEYFFQSKHGKRNCSVYQLTLIRQDLNSFQDVLLNYRVLYDLDQPIRSINFRGIQHQRIGSKTSGFRVQVWTGISGIPPRAQGRLSHMASPRHSTNARPGSADDTASLAASSSRFQPVRDAPKYSIMVSLDKQYISIPLNHGHPQLSYGRAGILRPATIVVYHNATTIKILPHRRAGNKHFEVWRTNSEAKARSKGRVPALSLSPNESDHASVKTEHIELQFETPAETQAFANAFKHHNALCHYWWKCENEKEDEKNGIQI